MIFGSAFVCFGSLLASGGDAVSASTWLVPIGAGMAIGIAALGGTLSQGMTITKAMDGISRNPGSSDRMFLMFILGLAFIEAQTIFAFVISFLILGKM